ncbi:hypothetical protein D3C81_1348070 [compost metagenome]
MQRVHQLRHGRLARLLHLQTAIGVEACSEFLELTTPAGTFLPVHPRRLIRTGLHRDEVTRCRFRMFGQYRLNQRIGLLQRWCGGQGRWRCRPAFQRLLEHGDRTRVEGNEQHQPADDADPDVDVLVDLDDVAADLHGCALTPSPSASATTGRTPARLPPPATTTHAGCCGTDRRRTAPSPRGAPSTTC